MRSSTYEVGEQNQFLNLVSNREFISYNNGDCVNVKQLSTHFSLSICQEEIQQEIVAERIFDQPKEKELNEEGEEIEIEIEKEKENLENKSEPDNKQDQNNNILNKIRHKENGVVTYKYQETSTIKHADSIVCNITFGNKIVRLWTVGDIQIVNTDTPDQHRIYTTNNEVIKVAADNTRTTLQEDGEYSICKQNHSEVVFCNGERNSYTKIPHSEIPLTP